MEVIGLTDYKYFSLGNISTMTIEEVCELKKDMKKTLQNAKKNRNWTASSGMEE